MSRRTARGAEMSAVAEAAAYAAEKRDEMLALLAEHPDMQDHVRAWINEKRAPGTRSLYSSDTALFLRWLRQARGHVDLTRVDRKVVAAYMADQRDIPSPRTGRARAQSTLNHQIGTLGSLFKHLLIEEVVTRQPVPAKSQAQDSGEGKTPARTHDEMVRLVNAAQESSLRDALLVMLLYTSAARVSELTAADVGDLGVEEGYSVLRATLKGGKTRLMPLSVPVQGLLREYLGDRTEGPLILNNKGRRLTGEQVTTVLRKMATVAGLSSPHTVRPHVLRTSAITSLLNDGTPLADVQHYVGHSGPSTTMRYWRRTQGRSRDAAIAVEMVEEMTANWEPRTFDADGQPTPRPTPAPREDEIA